jgi:hypothetical protein
MAETEPTVGVSNLYYDDGLIQLDREALTILGILHRRAAEGLEDGAACVGGELKAAVDAELLDGSHQRHVAFRDDLSEINIAKPGALGHRQHQGQVGSHEVFAKVLRPLLPFDELFGRFLGQPISLHLLLELRQAHLRIVEAKKHDAFLVGCHELGHLADIFDAVFARRLIPTDHGELRIGRIEEFFFDVPAMEQRAIHIVVGLRQQLFGLLTQGLGNWGRPGSGTLTDH